VPSESFDLASVTRVTAGAVGPPGKRSFYLQVSRPGHLVSLALEKEQLLVLAQRLHELLPDPPAAGEPSAETGLQEPLVAAWRVGTMTLAYDEDAKRFDVSLLELAEEGMEPATGHFEASVPQMRALAKQALAVVAAGRPPCPVCGGPFDHDGRVCPRANGHQRV